ncbi:MAG TPA: ATP-binding protein [Fluviicoccus sp.]|nr:ATP-binding protein [Fluviicoccus sp.]
MMNSIKARLTRSFLAIIALALAISGGLGFLTARHEIDELFDAQLVEEAQVLGGLLSLPAHDDDDWKRLQHALSEDVDGGGQHRDRPAYQKKVAVQVWSDHAELLFRSEGAPETALSPRQAGLFQARVDDRDWHVYTLFLPDSHFWLMVAERSDIRRELSFNVAGSLLAGLLSSLLLAIILLRQRLGRDMAPLEDLRSAISQRRMDHLQGIRLEDEPEEIRPVIQAINHLFDQVTHGIERERAFLADAAHELRTPLSIIRLHAQNALQYPDIEHKNRSLEKVIVGVDRNARVVQQLLLMARLDASEILAGGMETVDLERVAAQLVHELRPMTEARRLVMTVTAGAALPVVAGQAELLAVLLRNLLENAVNHTPEGGAVTLALLPEPTGVAITVTDTGPGVPEDKLSLISRRFVRASPRDIQGTGLGLEIAGRIVRLHRGEIHFANRPEGGFSVRVSLPAAPEAVAPAVL